MGALQKQGFKASLKIMTDRPTNQRTRVQREVHNTFNNCLQKMLYSDVWKTDDLVI